MQGTVASDTHHRSRKPEATAWPASSVACPRILSKNVLKINPVALQHTLQHPPGLQRFSSACLGIDRQKTAAILPSPSQYGRISPEEEESPTERTKKGAA